MLQAGFLLLVAVSVLLTSFISGIFGMAGGMILMGVLVAFMPVSAAMVLHAAAQLTSNGWRALLWRRHVDFRIFGRFLIGLFLAGLMFSFIGFVPDRALVLLTLGIVPFLVLLIPRNYVPQATSRGGAELCGFLNTSMQFIAGVSGPLLDVFYVRSTMDRRAVVATKAICQAAAHLAKLIYFGHILSSDDPVSALLMAIAVGTAIIGTSLSKFVLERLSDHQFRRWTQGLVMVLGSIYLVQGVYLMATR
ncbi:MAG: sulfite exporter TauE/SafE family protein [Pigmentiphaga sp.]|nr:sulfite exporter TauE/SafE family protein [Pigmentiphaga sp.]